MVVEAAAKTVVAAVEVMETKAAAVALTAAAVAVEGAHAAAKKAAVTLVVCLVVVVVVVLLVLGVEGMAQGMAAALGVRAARVARAGWGIHEASSCLSVWVCVTHIALAAGTTPLLAPRVPHSAPPPWKSKTKHV